MINRRGVMVGGAAIAASAVAGRAVDQGLVFDLPAPGLAAWEDWRLRRYQGPLALVSAGLLAASPHNSQPWHFALGRLGVDVFEAPERGLGAMDAFGRERLAGLGAAIHNMALAASSIGRAAAVVLLPDAGNPLHVARIELGPEGGGVAAHPLLAAIGSRHTHRGAWTGRPLSATELVRVRAFPLPDGVAIALFAATSARGQAFAAQTLAATTAIVGDPGMLAAGHLWFRHSRHALNRHKDGLEFATSGLSPLVAMAGAMLPAPSATDAGTSWLVATRDTALATASAFGVITVGDPWNRRSALLVGMAWQRLHLQATAMGLVAQPLNQVPEMIDRERQLRRFPEFARAFDPVLDDASMRPGLAFRLGRAAAAPPSVRRPVSVVIGAPARMAYDVARAHAETLAHEALLARRH